MFKISQNLIKITIEKMVFGGQGLGRLDGKACFVWNALPGEVVEARIIKNKKDYCEAEAVNILTPSPDRIAPIETHYMSCSPWQMMSWQTENKWKREMSIETYRKVGGLDLDPEIFALDNWQIGYRNKMEYSFTDNFDGVISLAFFNRGQHGRAAHAGCILADPAINETAKIILDWVNKHKIPYRSLKSVIVRSNNAGETIVALFIKDKMEFSDYPTPVGKFLGFQIYFSKYNSPASVPTESLYKDGWDYLTAVIPAKAGIQSLSFRASPKGDEESLSGLVPTKLKFGLLSFFQVHIPVFETALSDMAKFISAGDEAVDFYAGVGAISLPLRERLAGAVLVDNNSEAVEYARDNIKLNKAKNFSAECVAAENITNLIEADKILILDPPRAGLHQDVVAAILEKKPKKILYLSCNLSTQARDLKALVAGGYKIKFSRLYNFFPRTPHVEGLVVLER